MFCIECGAPIPENSKFCLECGCKITSANKDKPEKPQSNAILNMFEEVPVVEEKKTLEPKPVASRPLIQQPEKTEPKPVISQPTTEPSTPAFIERKLEALSTTGMLAGNKVASPTLNPIEDPYWDDVLPEIENEINSIPRDNIVKVMFSILALFAVIAYLVIML